jgi:uncharacterized repeat protein (TIGR01451 family)
MDARIARRTRATAFRRAGRLAVALLMTLSFVGPSTAGVAAVGLSSSNQGATALSVPVAGPTPAAGTLYFTRFCAQGGTATCGTSPGMGTNNVGKVDFTFDGTTFTLATPSGIASTGGADGIIFAPNGHLLVAGQQNKDVYEITTGGTLVTTKSAAVISDHLTITPDGLHLMVGPTSSGGTGLGTVPMVSGGGLGGAGSACTVTGDDTSIASIAYDGAGHAYYTNSGSAGTGNFGTVTLSFSSGCTATTHRLIQSLPAAHGMRFDPQTGTLILDGANMIAQVNPAGNSSSIVAEIVFGTNTCTASVLCKVEPAFPHGSTFDQAAPDGSGHILGATNGGDLIFIDFSGHNVADPNFVDTKFLANQLDDVAPLVGPGSATDLAVQKQVTGDTSNFPGGTFGFTITCDVGGPYSTSVTLAAGVTSGLSIPVLIKAGAKCTVTENTPLPAAGTGYTWGTATYSPTQPVTVVAQQTVTVTVSNPRAHDQGFLKIAKVFDPTTSGFSGNFTIKYNCGAGNQTVTLAAGASTTVGPFNTGTSCTVSEPTLPTAPTGWTFGTPSISGSPATVTKGTADAAVAVNVANSISRDTGFLKITKVFDPKTSGFSGTFSITYNCGSGDQTVALAAGASTTVGPFDAGTSCTVTEPTLPTAPTSWAFGTPSISSSPATVTKGTTLTAVAVSVANSITRDAGTLTIAKTLSNPDGATVPASFTINYNCGTGFTGSRSVAPGGSATVPGIPTGSTCTVSEAALTPITGFTWGTPTVTPDSVVIGSTTGTFSLTVANSISRPVLAVVKSAISTSDSDPADPQNITANPGDTVTYTVVVSNTGTADATGVTMSDDLTNVLAHATFGSVTASTATFSSPTLTWTGTVTAGGTVTITYTVTLATSGWPVGTTPLPNLAVITAANSNCITGGEPCSSGTVTNVTAGTDLRITKSVDPATINGGVSTPVTYTITVTNSGTALTFSDVMVSDPDLPTVVPFFTGTTTCLPSVSGCTWANLVGSGIDAGKLDAGQSFKVTVTGTANPNNTTDVGKHVNTADATFTPGPEQDQATISENATLTVLLTPQPALSITKGVSLSAAGPFVASLTGLLTGTTVHYQITVANTGNVSLTSVQLADDHYNLVSLGCTIPTSLAVSASFTCSYSATAVLGTTTNTATASATYVEQTVGPVQASATIAARTSSLTIAKAVTGNSNGTDPILDVPSAKVGDTLSFTLTYTLGSGPVTNAVITDVLPQGYGAPTAISNDGTGAPGTWNATTRTITWKWPTLSASGTLSYKVVVLTGADALAQPLTNVASIVSDQTAPASASRDVAIPGAVLAATATPRVTPPPTDAIYVPEGSGTGNNLLLVLLALAAFGLVLGFVTPKPARARQRNRRD